METRDRIVSKCSTAPSLTAPSLTGAATLSQHNYLSIQTVGRQCAASRNYVQLRHIRCRAVLRSTAAMQKLRKSSSGIGAKSTLL